MKAMICVFHIRYNVFFTKCFVFAICEKEICHGPTLSGVMDRQQMLTEWSPQTTEQILLPWTR